MSLYQCGMSLKALLESPELLAPPKKQDEGKGKTESVEFDGNLFASQAAFLGPQLWEKTYDEDDLKLEFMDLDEFLLENNISAPMPDTPQQLSPRENVSASNSQQHSPQVSPGGESVSQLSALLTQNQPDLQEQTAGHQRKQHHHHPGLLAIASPQSLSPATSPQINLMPVSPNSLRPTAQPQPSGGHSPTTVHQSQHLGMCHSPSGSDNTDVPSDAKKRKHVVKEEKQDDEPEVSIEFVPNAADLMLARLPGEDFDPRNRTFSEEELRPQPVIKKSRKVFVPDEMKDDKYWARRKKNNIAARRSRDARRTKENQIAMRALFLEHQSDKMSAEVTRLLEENKELRRRLSKYEPDVTVD